jgi:6-phospho-3-hexuloisomerase
LQIPAKQTENLINQITKADRVYLVAIGRVSLSLQCFGKRLSHLGIRVELVGSLTEKPATKKDLLIVASGSGESLIPVQIAKKAKQIGCKILLITSAKKSINKRRYLIML